MEDPQPLPQPELPLCDSLIIWVSVVSARWRGHPRGGLSTGTSGCHVHLLGSLPVRPRPGSPGSPPSHSAPPRTGPVLHKLLQVDVRVGQSKAQLWAWMIAELVNLDHWSYLLQLMSKEIVSSPAGDTVGELEQQLKRALEELQEAVAEKEELKQRCQELDMQVTALQDEKNSLVSENEMMNEKLDQLDGSFDDPNTMVAKKYFHAQLQLEQLQEENYRLEAAKDDYRVHCEELEKQLIEFQHRNDELTSLAEETRALKDEIDVLRTTSDKANKLESTVEVYRQKLQDLNDLRKQVKSLQETNMMYMHNTVSLEEELKKANAVRAQLETYKRQRLIEQRDTLKETNEELRCSQAQQDHLNQADASATKSYENLAAEIMPVEYREVFIRLQHENKMLRLQQEGTENERIEQLQEQLEQKHRKMNELETEQRLSKERIRELQQQIEDLQKSLQDQGSKTEGETSECKVAKFRDYEEKLIVSAWYNKSLAFQKLGMESRLVSGTGACKDTGSGPPARSFLAQQRHITNTRRNLSVKVPAAASD
ncbi:hook microtubule tethering protein 1 [Cricetulus griseus]